MTTTIAETARRIRTALEMDHQTALILATTYAIQCDIDTGTQEGGQAPDVELDEETADFIVEAARRAAALA